MTSLEKVGRRQQIYLAKRHHNNNVCMYIQAGSKIAAVATLS